MIQYFKIFEIQDFENLLTKTTNSFVKIQSKREHIKDLFGT